MTRSVRWCAKPHYRRRSQGSGTELRSLRRVRSSHRVSPEFLRKPFDKLGRRTIHFVYLFRCLFEGVASKILMHHPVSLPPDLHERLNGGRQIIPVDQHIHVVLERIAEHTEESVRVTRLPGEPGMVLSFHYPSLDQPRNDVIRCSHSIHERYHYVRQLPFEVARCGQQQRLPEVGIGRTSQRNLAGRIKNCKKIAELAMQCIDRRRSHYSTVTEFRRWQPPYPDAFLR